MTFDDATEATALRLDAEDRLTPFRERFSIPKGADGRPVLYLNGNSLGLMPYEARTLVEHELDDWARLGVEGHFKGRTPWYAYHEVFREPAARLVGAKPGEVVVMNSLTVNLHLMMATFYRPTPGRHKILIEDAAFPSDGYATRSQLRLHGYDPEEGLVIAKPSEGESTLRTEDLEVLIEARGAEIALVMMSGVHYYTGQWFEMERVTRVARERGCIVGWDLAHAAGNVPLSLHAWDVDFAAWCSYKYLNAGPGGVAGCFVHERHGSKASLPRMAGWWGNDPERRFRMHLEPEFVPRQGADGWQLSNPPILAMAPLRASLAIFDEAGMEALRAKSIRLTGYLEWLLDRAPGRPFEIITPRDPDRRGCQLSLRILDRPEARFEALERAGVVVDFRAPDVIRVAPVPLYNTFREVWTLARLLTHLGEEEPRA